MVKNEGEWATASSTDTLVSGGGGHKWYSTSHEDDILSEVTDSLTKVVFDLDTPANIGKQLD